MSILGGTLMASALSDLQHPTAWLSAALSAGRKTKAGQEVTAHSSLTLPVYYAAIRNIAEDIGKVPLPLYRRLAPRGREVAGDHPAYPLIHDAPNPEMSAQAFRELLTHWALGWGMGYAEIVRSGPVAVELWPIHPSRVRPFRTESGELWYRVRSGSGDDRKQPFEVEIPFDDMLVIHGLGTNGTDGYSAVQVAAEALGLGLALQSYASTFFGGSTAINSLLKMPKLDKQAVEEARKMWVERYSGPNASQSPAFLPPGWEFQRIDINPADAQAVESRKFQIEDVARVLRMPLSKIGAGNGGAGGEQEAIAYVVETLMPWGTRWETEYARKLLPMAERASHYCRHTWQALMRGDHAARGSYYQTQFHNGSMSPNDIRELEDMNPIEGGDVYLVPLNMIPIDKSGEYAEAVIKKAGEAPAPTERNPTDQGGGENNQPPMERQPQGPQSDNRRKITARFLSSSCQRLAEKAAKASEAAAHKANFGKWAGDFYATLLQEATSTLSEPVLAGAELLGATPSDRWTGVVVSTVAGWRERAVEAQASNSITGLLISLRTTAGPSLASDIVDAITGDSHV